ncbi:MAG: hypothetical protein HW386_1261 [Gammaproteobacteria bacterium]|nr:hypothetical protein [Gammaproteobacteria bacterium]
MVTTTLKITPTDSRLIKQLDIYRKAAISGVMTTAMLPLWARAQESLQPNPLFKDEIAVELARLLDLDYGAIRDAWQIQTSVAIRTRILDDNLHGYLQKYPDAAIINLGAGFDSRYYRMDNGSLIWYDLDFPQLLELKRMCFSETRRYRMLGKSILDFSWLDEIADQGRPVMILAEGVLMYLRESELITLFEQLAGKFAGAHLLIELLAPGAIGYHPLLNRDNAEFKWTLLNARDMEAINPKIRFLHEWCVLDYYNDRWQWLAVLGKLPLIRNYFGERIVHLRFQ